MVNNRKALHANLLKITLHHRYFSRNLTIISGQRYWKINLDGYFWGQIFWEHSWMAASQRQLQRYSPNGYHILHFLPWRHVKEEPIFMFFYKKARFAEKFKHTELILFKNSNLVKETHFLFILIEYQHRDPTKNCF